MKSAKPILVLLLVFMAGLAVGVFGTRYVIRRDLQEAVRDGSFIRDRIHRDLVSKLELTPEQEKQLQEIMSKSHDEFRKLRSEIHPRFAEITQRSEKEIAAILTPEQRLKFEEIKKERRPYFRPPPPPPEGGERTNRPGFRPERFERPDRPQ